MKRLVYPFLTAFMLAPVAPGAEADPKDIEFFEKKIRPVLTENCWECHSAEAAHNKKLKGGLFLDSRDGFAKGGDSGRVTVPGKPAQSRLLRVLRHEIPDQKMPPKGKLPDAVVADIARWVELGAPWPADAGGGAAKRGPDYATLVKEHWAYQPVKPVAPPDGAGAVWSKEPIDRFIHAKLTAHALKPSPAADKLALVRRVYFDLIGLPPTPEQIDEFLRDSAAKPQAAYEALVDKLLASPRFGERWGRHWLDVARYGESLTLRGFVLKDAWRYRDYVIESFNKDVPYDRFMMEQVAGDLMTGGTLEERRQRMTATTLLMLGNNNLEEQNKKQLDMDVVDEQLDVISKAFLAQTITCARCHDHKFDPIPTKDYYALAGILASVKSLSHANVSMWLEIPLPGDQAKEAEYAKHDQAVAALKAKVAGAKAALAKLTRTVNDKPVVKATVIDPKTLLGIVVDDTQAKKIGTWKASTFSKSYIGDGYSHDEDMGKGEKTISFLPALPKDGKYEVRFAYVHGGNRTKKAKVTVFSADGEKSFDIDQTEPPDIDGHFVALGRYNFEKAGQSFVIVSNEESKGHVIADAVQFIPIELLDMKQEPAPKKDKPAAVGKDAEAAALADTVKKMEAELKRMQDLGPKRETFIGVQEQKPRDVRIHIRGSVGNLGAEAPRGFMTAVSVHDAPAIPADQSGRRQLGEWLAAKDNPLPARVMANRVWHWLMGQGLVRTVDNFGTTGEVPSHPELLDHLANSFVQDGWSVKKLVRRIVLSQTYQQSSTTKSEADPENRWLGRMSRRRLDAECLYDGMLAASGDLSLAAGGPSYKGTPSSDYGYKHADTRRAVYAPVFRNALPELFEAFDFADPSLPTGRRSVSTVAPQALFLMNSPWVKDRAKAAAMRLLAMKDLDDGARITLAYRTTLGRPPAEGERRVAEKFLSPAAKDLRKLPEAWAQLVQALFASVDFRYVD